MRRFAFLAVILLALTGSVSVAMAQSQTGTITGQVTDEQGAVLPGVTVTVTGRQGSQNTVSDERGVYRFLGLNPGVYTVTAELSGFAPRTEQNIDVGLNREVRVNLQLTVGSLSETVEVVGTSANVDATSTATDNTLSQDILATMPINIGNFNTATSIMNYAPGINGGAGFGGDEDYGNALLIDGVDTRDPEGGSSWVFFNYNIVEEVQVGGLGAQAEYGGFTGGVVNTITKSGGNMFSGLFEARHTNDDLAGDNIDEGIEALNPSLAEPSVITKLWDYTAQFGGPLKKNKAFYFASVQRYAFDRDPSGPLTLATEVSPRYNVKLTFLPTSSDTITGAFQYDNYNVTGRAGNVPSSTATDTQTLRQDSPEAVWNAQYRRVFGTNTFFEAKFTGYWGYYYLDPVDPAGTRFDIGTGAYAGGAGYYYYADRGRNQVNAAVTHYAQKYGTHNFKFGVEIERSNSRSQYGYMDRYYLDYYGEPYLAYEYSYDIEGDNRRFSAYAQDAWQVGRLTASLGLRLDNISGRTPSVNDAVYTPDLSVGPRLGLTYDLTGAGNSVLKAFWGRYYEGAAFAPYQFAVPGRNDYVGYFAEPGGPLEEDFRIPELVYGIDDDIKHMRVDEFTVGFEHQLRRDMKVAVTGIWRDWDQFTSGIVPNGTWSPVTVTTGSGLTGAPLTLYEWVNRDETESERLIRNIAGFQYKDPNGNVIGTLDPTRKYKAAMFVLTKNYSNRWQAQASYVWSETKGNVANDGLVAWRETYLTPSTGIVNADGLMENDRPHEFKLFGSYQVPVLELSVGAYFRAISGQTYTPNILVSGSTLNFPGSITPFLEPRGSRRYPTQKTVDLRFEKRFNFDVHRIGVFLDVGNIFNQDTVLLVQTRYPRRTIADFPVEFGSPTSIEQPRQFTFGARWQF
jgi:hypothetical protein